MAAMRRVVGEKRFASFRIPPIAPVRSAGFGRKWKSLASWVRFDSSLKEVQYLEVLSRSGGREAHRIQELH